MSAVARKLESIREKGALRHIDVANVLGMRPETESRWNQGRAYPHASTEKTLLELEFIVDQLSDFYEPNEAASLFSRHRSCWMVTHPQRSFATAGSMRFDGS
ncbi:MAG: hypothetical protein IT537_24510 [Hyphomicrobiales bacterium]|nr:hypothetical protein [Hyphomicrobiales bacterium]